MGLRFLRTNGHTRAYQVKLHFYMFGEIDQNRDLLDVILARELTLICDNLLFAKEVLDMYAN